MRFTRVSGEFYSRPFSEPVSRDEGVDGLFGKQLRVSLGLPCSEHVPRRKRRREQLDRPFPVGFRRVHDQQRRLNHLPLFVTRNYSVLTPRGYL